MSITSTTSTTASSEASSASLATSARFKKFAITVAIVFPVLYVVCDIFNLPLFTYHPGTNRVGLGWEAARGGEGPAMYWYGWTGTCLVVGTFVGLIGSLLPDAVIKKVPLILTWALYLVAVPFLVYSLMPFWTK